MLEILETDQFFYDSPDAGHPNCICSRCRKKIPEKDAPIIRAWPDEPGDYGFDPSAKNGTEFRYCRECSEKMGIHFPDDPPEEYFDPNF